MGKGRVPRSLSLTSLLALLLFSTVGFTQPIENSLGLYISKGGLNYLGDNIEEIVQFYGYGLRTTRDLNLTSNPENPNMLIEDGYISYVFDKENLLEMMPDEYTAYHNVYDQVVSVLESVQDTLRESMGDKFKQRLVLKEPHVGVEVERVRHQLDFAEPNGFNLRVDPEMTRKFKQETGIQSGVAIQIRATIPYLEINFDRLEFFDRNNPFDRPAFVNASASLLPGKHQPLELEGYFFIHVVEPGVFELIPHSENIILNDIDDLGLEVHYEELYVPDDTLVILGANYSDMIREFLNGTLQGENGRILAIARQFINQFANSFLPDRLKEIAEIHIPANLRQKNYFQPPGAGESIVEPLSYAFDTLSVDTTLEEGVLLNLAGHFIDDSSGPFAHTLDSEFDHVKPVDPKDLKVNNKELSLALHQSFINQLFVLAFNRGYLDTLEYRSPREQSWFLYVNQKVSCEQFYQNRSKTIEAVNLFQSVMEQTFITDSDFAPSLIEALTRAGFDTLDDYVAHQFDLNCQSNVSKQADDSHKESFDMNELQVTLPPQVEILEGGIEDLESLSCRHPMYTQCQKLPIRLGIKTNPKGFLTDIATWGGDVEVHLRGYVLLLLNDKNELFIAIDSFDVEEFLENDEANRANKNFIPGLRGISKGRTANILRDFNRDHKMTESTLFLVEGGQHYHNPVTERWESVPPGLTIDTLTEAMAEPENYKVWNPLFINEESPFKIMSPVMGLDIVWSQLSINEDGFIIVGGDFLKRGER